MSNRKDIDMITEIKTKFIEKWERYFPGSELPIACYYADNLNGAEFPDAPKAGKHGFTCVFSQLAPVRVGKARAFNRDNLGCWGATGTFGFTPSTADEHTVDFLVNVERYKKSAAHVKAMYASTPFRAGGKYLIFKRWDLLNEKDSPQVVFFFCNPDAISGLHSLANFDTMDPHGVVSPFGSGCESVVGVAMKELRSDEPKAVLGIFDTSARAFVKRDIMSFSVPWPKLLSMIDNMDDCFLNTYVWERIKNR